MTLSEAKSLAESSLSAKRFYHTGCVAAMARELALRYAHDPFEAELAAWLHDLLKEREKSDLLQMIEGSDIIDAIEIRRCPPLYHAFAAGVYLREELGLPSHIADAVAYHTTGRAAMSKLEKITYLADYISLDRAFPGVEEVRALAEQDLDAAVLEAMRRQIIHLAGSGKYIDQNSIAAYNYLTEKGDSNE